MAPAACACAAGLRQSRQACLHVARLALFDRARNRFLGNVLGLRPDAVTNRDSAWQFRPQASGWVWARSCTLQCSP